MLIRKGSDLFVCLVVRPLQLTAIAYMATRLSEEGCLECACFFPWHAQRSGLEARPQT